MKIWFFKNNLSSYQIEPEPEDKRLFIEKEVHNWSEIENKQLIEYEGNYIFVEREPEDDKDYKWDGEKWIIDLEKQTALFTQQKEGLLNKLAGKADQLKNSLLAGYPQTEIESFYRQERSLSVASQPQYSDTDAFTNCSRTWCATRNTH